jgi:peptidyl-prolyl cis-trans isomerase B (cyclophilin B)
VPPADKRQRQKENSRLAREAREAALRRSRQRKTAVRVGIFIALLVVVAALFATLGNKNKSKTNAAATSSSSSTPSTVSTQTTIVAAVPRQATATFDTNFGPIVVKLDTKNAPNASAHFIKLVKAGFYNGLHWVRASKNFVIQGGSPTNNQAGGEGHPIVGEVPKDGKYPVGSLAAAKSGADANGTFDSQFFIMTGTNPLGPQYARFGQVVSGLANAQKIEALAPASGDGPPTKTAIIKKITITEKN